jgi:hypothetical protein
MVLGDAVASWGINLLASAGMACATCGPSIVRDEEAAGSNPASPTKGLQPTANRLARHSLCLNVQICCLSPRVHVLKVHILSRHCLLVGEVFSTFTVPFPKLTRTHC